MAANGRQATTRRGFALVLAGLFASAGIAGSHGRLETLYREHWTTRDGLPHNSVNAIAQTPEGYLWFATWEGLVRFNGREFTTFDRRDLPGLRDAALRALEVDPAGHLVLGGARGGLLRQTADDGWEALPPAPVMVTEVATAADGRLWATTETAGVYRRDPDGRTRVLPVLGAVAGGAGNDLLVDHDGRVWAATATGLFRVTDDGVQPAGAEGLPTGPVTALANLPDGRLLVGTPAGLFVADPAAPRLAFHPLATDARDVAATRLLPDRHGGVWIGTLNQGLMHWDGRRLARLGVGPDKPGTRVLSLFLDREDHLWVGTNGGLYRFIDAPFTSITRQQGLNDDFVRALLPTDGGRLLVGTAQGLALADGDGVATPLGQGTPIDRVSILSLAAGFADDTWIGTYTQGVLRWDGQQVQQRIDTAAGLPSNEVRALAPDRDGGLWIGTTRGLAHWRGGRFTAWTERDGLPSNFVISLMLDGDGVPWIGTGTGAARLDDGRLQRLDLGGDAEYAFGFLPDPAHGGVWVATDRGLARFDAAGRRTGRIGLAEGLPFEKVFGLVIDGEGRLWATGNRGLMRLDLARAHAVADGQALPLDAEHFTEADGMVSAQGNGGSQPVAVLDAAGRPWFATAIGATRVDLETLDRSTRRAPPVVLEALLADGVPLPIRHGMPVRLPADTRRIELRYAGLGVLLPERLRYRHRLEGFDEAWVERVGRTEAEFTGLAPGTYRFQVEAAHARGDWGGPAATLVFEIPPQWWQRRGVAIAAGLGGVLLALGLYRLRIRRLVANEQALAMIVEERTAEIDRQKGLLRRQAEEFARQAREDALTGLPNRRDFDERLAKEFARAARSNEPLAVVLVDIDHFKAVNDRWSHAVGDEVLRRVARALAEHCRSFDTVARWGGEEFALLLPGTDRDEAARIAERVRAGVEALDFSDIDPALRVTASAGLATDRDPARHDELMRRADEALYRAKANGRNRVEA